MYAPAYAGAAVAEAKAKAKASMAKYLASLVKREEEGWTVLAAEVPQAPDERFFSSADELEQAPLIPAKRKAEDEPMEDAALGVAQVPKALTRPAGAFLELLNPPEEDVPMEELLTKDEAAERCRCKPEELCPGPLAGIDESDKIRTIYDGSKGGANAHIQAHTEEKTTAPMLGDCLHAIHWLRTAANHPHLLRAPSSGTDEEPRDVHQPVQGQSPGAEGDPQHQPAIGAEGPDRGRRMMETSGGLDAGAEGPERRAPFVLWPSF